MISYRFVAISSQKGVLFLRHPVDQNRCKFVISTLSDQLKMIKRDTMYIFRRVVHENLVTMETRLKIQHQNCYCFIAI